jgi:hypothetical protein
MSSAPRSIDQLKNPTIASVARDSARRVLSAVDGLDPLRRSAFLWDASVDEPGVLNSIADAYRKAPAHERADYLALSLYAEGRFFDGADVVLNLGDGEPWLTIRRAMWDVINAIDEERGPGPLCSVARRHSVREIPRP